SNGRTFNAIVSFLGHAPGQSDIALLAALISTVEQNDKHAIPPHIVDAIAGAEMQPQFLHAVAYRFSVSGIPAGEALQPGSCNHRPHFRCVLPYRILRVPGRPSLLR